MGSGRHEAKLHHGGRLTGERPTWYEAPGAGQQQPLGGHTAALGAADYGPGRRG
jgi:hypothetical protein